MRWRRAGWGHPARSPSAVGRRRGLLLDVKRNVELAAMLANLTARGIGRLFAEGGTMIHTHEICLILPPSERTCRRLSQDVASRQTLRNRKVINTKSAR